MRVRKQRPSNRQLRQLGGAEMAKRCSIAITDPALADSEAIVDSALQDADWLPPGQGPDLDPWESGSLSPNSLV